MITARSLAIARPKSEVLMTDVLAPVLVPYARFLEVRATRFEIVTELMQPDGQRTIDLLVSSAPIANDERACGDEPVPSTDPAGVEPS
jgi:hypothetical protein